MKTPTSFSKVKQFDLLQHMQKNRGFNAAKTGQVPCVNCTGGQRVELMCSDCEVWKGKNAYNKTQWKKDDDEAVRFCQGDP